MLDVVEAFEAMDDRLPSWLPSGVGINVGLSLLPLSFCSDVLGLLCPETLVVHESGLGEEEEEEEADEADPAEGEGVDRRSPSSVSSIIVERDVRVSSKDDCKEEDDDDDDDVGDVLR